MDIGMGSAATPRSVEASQGLNWWSQAWVLFMRQAGVWLVLGLVFLVTFAVSLFVPVLGPVATCLLVPVLVGAFMLAARRVEGGGALEAAALWAAVQPHFTPLLVLGALLAAATFVMGVVAGLLGVGGVFGAAAAGMHGSAGGMMAGLGVGMLGLLLSLLMGTLLGMLFWFAPALVVFRGMAPVDAMKASLAASLKNIVPFLLYSIVYCVLAFIASIPFGLGWLVLVPVLLLTVYVSYRDVFGA
jgi:uncharacterized membrane protein